MADIYRNSYVTVAAVSSSDFRSGCYSPNKTGDACFKVREHQAGRELLVAIRDSKGVGRVHEHEHITQVFPLLTRAWVYQERLLSRRVLYCNHSELQLECRESIVCECSNRAIIPHPGLRTPASRETNHIKGHYAEVMKNHGIPGRFSSFQLCLHWQRTVASYSKLQLTQAGDKLPALSGCAKDTGSLTRDEYLAGIWRAAIAEGLFWIVNHPVYHPRPAVWRAPSWLWASVDTLSGVDYTYPLLSRSRQDFQTKVEAAKCTLAGADSTGAVSSGFIRVRSGLCPVYLRRLCRNCSKTKVRYTIEHSAWYALGRPARWKPCTFKDAPILDVGAGILNLFPDFKYSYMKDFTLDADNEEGVCRLGPVSLLYLYDGQSHASPNVTDFS